MRKKAWRKSMLKFDVIKNQKNRRINRPWRYFDSFFGRFGGKGGWLNSSLRLQADFNGSFTRHAPQAGCGGFLVRKTTMARSWSIDSTIFEGFEHSKKSSFFNVALGRPKIDENRDLEALGESEGSCII